MNLIEWLNETLDDAAVCLGKKATRDAVFVLMILPSGHGPMTGKKLVKTFKEWNVSAHSTEGEPRLPLRAH